MKNVQRFLLLVCFVIPIGLLAQADLAGNWESKVPADDGSMMIIKVTINANGTYALDFGGDGTVDVKGKYQAKDGKMTIQDDSSADGCSGKGVYQYEVSKTTMTMTRISDECDGRGGPEGKMEFTRA